MKESDIFKKLRRGFELFAGGEEHLDQAKDYIKKNGFTSDDVKIVRRTADNEIMILVVKK